jgi:hypothetical protein
MLHLVTSNLNINVALETLKYSRGIKGKYAEALKDLLK